jgi:hypothetical protein
MQISKPIVKRKIRGVKFIRHGRGFSKSELKATGIVDIRMAKNKGVLFSQATLFTMKYYRFGTDILNIASKR